MEVVASLSQGRTAAAQRGLFTHKSVPVIFEPPCTMPVLHSDLAGRARCLLYESTVSLSVCVCVCVCVYVREPWTGLSVRTVSGRGLRASPRGSRKKARLGHLKDGEQTIFCGNLECVLRNLKI